MRKKTKYVIFFVIMIIAYTQIGLYTIQPIGAIPEGKTLIVWRSAGEPFFNSADGTALRIWGGVSLLNRGLALTIAPVDRIIIRLPYWDFAYLQSIKSPKPKSLEDLSNEELNDKLSGLREEINKYNQNNQNPQSYDFEDQNRFVTLEGFKYTNYFRDYSLITVNLLSEYYYEADGYTHNTVIIEEPTRVKLLRREGDRILIELPDGKRGRVNREDVREYK